MLWSSSPTAKMAPPALPHGSCKLLDPGVLKFVGVLKLVNQDVLEASTVVFTHGLVVSQQLIGAQHQLTKIDHAFALALRLVELVQLHFFSGFFVTHFHVFGA